jgi:Amt family ammonium transporter
MGNQVDQLWVLVAAGLIFLMQAGFLCLEVGFVRPKNVVVTAMKNMADWSIVSLIWLVVGFGVAFGHTAEGLIGTDLFFGDGLTADNFGWTFFLFQLGFAGTSATIVSGAMAERVSFNTYLVVTAANALFIYPVVAHWVWGTTFFPDQSTWLSARGFHDFAGSTAVHSVGGWISLIGIWQLGPRLGRFGADGKPRPTEVYSLPLVGLGVFLLWFGWFGFNGGSTLTAGDGTALVIAKTNVAGAAAGVVAYAHASLLQRREDLEAKFMGGLLTGLVAITAGAAVVPVWAALVIGALAGLAHNLCFQALLRARLDDPVGAVPVHLAGGVLGTLCVGLFADLDVLNALTKVDNSRGEQIVAQLTGVGAVAVWTCVVSFILLKVLRATTGLRVSPQQEAEGIITSQPAPAPPPALSEDEIRKLMGG